MLTFVFNGNETFIALESNWQSITLTATNFTVSAEDASDQILQTLLSPLLCDRHTKAGKYQKWCKVDVTGHTNALVLPWWALMCETDQLLLTIALVLLFATPLDQPFSFGHYKRHTSVFS